MLKSCRKLALLFMAAAMLMPCAIHAAPCAVNVPEASLGGQVYRDLYFDFEEGMWVGERKGDWRHIEAKNKLALPDGGFLVVKDNMPGVEKAGEIRILQ